MKFFAKEIRCEQEHLYENKTIREMIELGFLPLDPKDKDKWEEKGYGTFWGILHKSKEYIETLKELTSLQFKGTEEFIEKATSFRDKEAKSAASSICSAIHIKTGYEMFVERQKKMFTEEDGFYVNRIKKILNKSR